MTNRQFANEAIICEGCRMYAKECIGDCHAKRILNRINWDMRHGGFDFLVGFAPLNATIIEKSKGQGDANERT